MRLKPWCECQDVEQDELYVLRDARPQHLCVCRGVDAYEEEKEEEYKPAMGLGCMYSGLVRYIHSFPSFYLLA